MANKLEDEVRIVRSIRVQPKDLEKIIRKYGSLTAFVNACILEKVRGAK